MKITALVLATIALTASARPPPRSNELDSSYSFERYVKDFDKSYLFGTPEWTRRESIFNRNLSKILSHNALYYAPSTPAQEGSEGGDAPAAAIIKQKRPTHTLGVNHLTDLEADEVHYGYDKANHDSFRSAGNLLSAAGDGNDDDTTLPTSVSRRRLLDGSSGHKMDLPFSIDSVTTLPHTVDWRHEGVVTPVKDQGMCGSCWAFAATAVLESHVAVRTGTLFDLAPQQLVSCVTNPHTCGGSGGCAGATAELAFDYVAEGGRGIVQEFQMGYESYYGGDGVCAMDGDIGEDAFAALRGGGNYVAFDLEKVKRAVANIDGYSVCPTNDYECLMNAVAKTGPVAVAVAASTWATYEGGVFTSDLSKGKAETDLNHAVVLVGYGTDEQTGSNYWLVRNSWRPTWGEGGYIRLERVDPSTLGDGEEDCGIDSTPLDGMACETDDDGKKLPPTPVKICGTSGVLFDAVMPVGGRLH